MKSFAKMNPYVNLIFYLFALGFSMSFRHPVLILLSFFCSLAYAAYIGRKKLLKTLLLFALPVIITMSAVNVLFNHYGVTVIGNIGGNSLTLESLFYGAMQGAVLSSVILWFTSFNEILSGEKIIYIFGSVSPKTAMIVRTALAFIPRFSQKAKEIRRAQKGMGELPSKSFFKRLKSDAAVFSMLITWSLETAADSALSMKSRGYSAEKRTFYSDYGFRMRDGAFLIVILALGICVTAFAIKKYAYALYDPVLSFSSSSESVVMFVIYGAFLLMPLIYDLSEDIKWKYSVSKI